MCGRYARSGDKQRIADTFHVKEVPDFAMPGADYNIAPTTFHPIVRESKETGECEMVLARWGLIPFFTKELNGIKGLSTINAKAETIATARTWRRHSRNGTVLCRYLRSTNGTRMAIRSLRHPPNERQNVYLRGTLGCLER
jgi:putative SOS response-associated peptidase YedK